MAINITDLNKADVLCALYNSSRPQGLGFMAYESEPMQRQEAEELLTRNSDFDYLKGRVMKVNLSNDDEFDESLYDRDNGNGAAQSAIDELRQTSDVASDGIIKQHHGNVEQSAALTKNRLHQETRISGDGTVTLGLSDFRDELDTAITKAKDSLR